MILYILINYTSLQKWRRRRGGKNLLQLDLLKSDPSMQVPFHLEGIGPIPASLKLSDSGQIPKK